MTYKWANPREWLDDKIAGAGEDWLEAALKSVVSDHLDFTMIQETFEAEMDADGYFEELSQAE